MAPPAKRRKRNIVPDDEDEDEEQLDDSPRIPKRSSLKHYFTSPDASAKFVDVENDDPPPPSPSPVRKSTRSTRLGPAVSTATRSRPSQTNVTKSPSKSPSKSKKAIEETGKSANIRTLFSKQSQKLKTESKPNGTSKGSAVPALDLTGDSLSDDEEVSFDRAVGTSFVGKKAQKRSKDNHAVGPNSSNNSVVTGQKFLRRAEPPISSYPTTTEDQRPWSERFGPVNLDELVVHKRKVADVRRWLDDVLNGRLRQRLLILKGSAGTGKTTTLQLLAKDMGFEMAEWRNPVGAPGSVPGTQSASAQFEEFMGRGRNFGQLDFEEDESTQTTNQTKSIDYAPQGGDRPRVMLIEEFPNTFMRFGSSLKSFRQTILQYLANSTPSSSVLGNVPATEPIIPAVMVISETLLTTTSASADSFTAHRLLGPEILRHPGTGVIEFNDIAPTLMIKALELVVKKEARISGRRMTPGPLVLKRFGEMVDIRNAVSALEFLCLKGDADADWGSKVAFTKTKKTSKSQALTEGEKRSLELVSRREASLGIFHAVGKVVYNKRDEQPYALGSDEALAERMPPHLTPMRRDTRSQVSADTLIDETGTDTSTFISALHENYILSCERPSTTDPNSSVDYVNGCIEYLSESDLLHPTWDIFFGGKGFSGSGRDHGSHVLRQDEMAFETAVRGLLFSLPCPVKRKANSTSSRGSDTFKMFYPTSIKLWREKEEVEDLVDLWASKMLKCENSPSALTPTQRSSQSLVNGASVFRKNKESSVGNPTGKQSDLRRAVKAKPKVEAVNLTEESPALLSLGSSARQEMILERLPYMAQIMRGRGRATTLYSLGLRDVEKVVSFHGISASADEESDDGAEEELGIPAGEAWATDKPTEDGYTPKKKRKNTVAIRPRNSEQSEGSMISNLQVHKLVLSDDDIEDDD